MPAGGARGRSPALIALDGGAFRAGTDAANAIPGDGESPVRTMHVAPFRIAATAVSVDEFAAFVAATGWVTTAERHGWSFVMAAHPVDPAAIRGRAAGTPWWLGVDGASWRAPHGPGSSAIGGHPVVHVSHDDALAWCAWSATRLPTEWEWELAARGGYEGLDFPWPGVDEPRLADRANVWRGPFPHSTPGVRNGTVPVDACEPNAFGLRNVIGNVWEWTASPWAADDARLVQRGGSYLCHASYCRRYRVSARTAHDREDTAGNVGFRVAADPDPADPGPVVSR
ncbi:MAG: SUMF1/EgtB/PvdO family nonheme iron enzyme [Chloroflexota bacterium]